MSYDDVNFHVTTDDGEFVLKVHNEKFRTRSHVEFQHAVMRKMAESGLPVPKPLTLYARKVDFIFTSFPTCTVIYTALAQTNRMSSY